MAETEIAKILEQKEKDMQEMTEINTDLRTSAALMRKNFEKYKKELEEKEKQLLKRDERIERQDTRIKEKEKEIEKLKGPCSSWPCLDAYIVPFQVTSWSERVRSLSARSELAT